MRDLTHEAIVRLSSTGSHSEHGRTLRPENITSEDISAEGKSSDSLCDLGNFAAIDTGSLFDGG